MSSPVVTLALWCLITIAGCGGDSGTTGPGPSSGVDRAKTLGMLTAAERAKACDWTAERQGGYGRNVTCPDGTMQDTDRSQATCLEGGVMIATLCPTLTIADIEDCTNDVSSDLCKFATAPGCANLRKCAAQFVPGP